MCKCYKNWLERTVVLVSSAAGDPEDGLELLENDQLKARGRGETRPDWDEAGVQTTRSVLCHNLHEEEYTDKLKLSHKMKNSATSRRMEEATGMPTRRVKKEKRKGKKEV